MDSPRATVDEQVRILTAGTADVVSEAELRERLARGAPLRVKLGIDPTASDIHLGFAVVLRKLRQFQDLGHVAVLILGDFTAQVGDPTGRSATRPRLSREAVDANAQTYVRQIAEILDPDPARLEIRRNSEWLAAMGIDDVLRLMARTTVARMLERDDFSKRYTTGAPISVMEFLYPLLQGWDSVVVRADVELGGTDQLFNNLMGRDLQRQEGQESQIVITTPLLEGTDGVKKMSKSLGNYIGVAEPPAEQFGKLMRIPDTLLPRYLALTTGWLPDRVEEVTGALERGELPPNEAKRLLGRTVVDLYHGPGVGEEAEAGFNRVFRDRGVPEEIDGFALDDVDPAEWRDGRIRLARLLALAGLAPSGKEASRRISDGAVGFVVERGGPGRAPDDGPGAVPAAAEIERVDDPDATFSPVELRGRVLRVGKRHWVRWV